jgi:8-oxo-dGTP pyrophosphatase MutT (NUDIX family)
MRSAASLILLRDAAAGPEVLLVRRGERGDFPGLHVFPGGLVDEADRDPRLCQAADCDAGLACELTGNLPEALAHRVAVIRECFEETGILLGSTAGGHDLADWRARLLARETGFAELAEATGLQLQTRALGYFSHWITPEGIPRRYDTRFFVARVGPDAVATPDERETVGIDWLRPQEALDAHRRGDLKLIFPTIRNLMELAGWQDSESLLETCCRPRELPAMLPRMRLRDGRMELLLPGDPGYAEAQ